MARVDRKANESLESLLRRFRTVCTMANIQGNARDKNARREKQLSRKHRKNAAIFLSNSKRVNREKWLKV